MFEFDLQRFKGNTTVENSYEPTEHELELQKASADYAKAVAPNAYRLNDLAGQLLTLGEQGLRNAQPMYEALNNKAQWYQDNALDVINRQIEWNINNFESAHDKLKGLPEQYSQIGSDTASKVGGLAGGLNNAYGTNVDSLNNIYGQIGNATNNANSALGGYTTGNQNAANNANAALGNYTNQGTAATNTANQALQGYIPSNDAATNTVNGLLGNYMNTGSTATNNANADLSEYINRNKDAFSTANQSLSGLQNGGVPQAYQDAMANSIATAMKNTVGKTINSLGQRGVLNSSVTNSAMNDIQKNAADATAQNFLNNINTLQSLAQNKWQDAITTDQQNAAMTQQQLGNTQTDINRNANLAQQRYGNTLNTNQANAGLTQQVLGNTTQNLQNATNNSQQQFSNLRNATDANANLTQQAYNNSLNQANTGMNVAQQLYNNANTNANSLNNLYNQQANWNAYGLDKQAEFAKQILDMANYTGALNTGLAQSQINASTAPITTAAAAQEGAMAPALNLWNASLGLNGANTSALGALAGKGTSTTTTSSGGGGFLSGLFGGIF